MNYGFITFCVLIGISLLISANQHGQERGDENFWRTLLSAVITMFMLLWAMGFKI